MRPELLLSAPSATVARYRRRVLALGILAAAVIAAIGAPAYLRGIERDLEQRVPAELAARGIGDVRATFSGQEGVLRCDTPLADPEGVLDVANAVTGVVLVELDRTCRVSSAPAESAAPAPTPAPAPTVPTTPPDESDESDESDERDERDDAAPTTTVASFDTVGELVASSPRFSLLAVLVGEAGAHDLFEGPGITVLAPDNDAFDELPADVLAELRTRPDLLREVLANHVVDDDVPLAELGRLADVAAEGDAAAVTTRAGDDLVVTRADGAIFVADAAVTDGDLVATNGVLHVVDRPLLPAELDLRALEGLPELVAVLRTGRLDLTGSVATAGDRTRLIGAAATAVAPVNVSHDIDVDPAAAIGGSELDVLVELVELAPSTLTSGSVGFDGSDVFVRGTVVDDAARAALGAVPGVLLELDPRPVASAADVDELNDELAELLAATPLTFAPASAELDPASVPLLDVIASVAKRFDGVAVLIEGHTDTVGDPQANLALSELRAAVVHLELAARGVPGEQLDHVGRGGADPVLVDGVEDRAASRRVELVVTLVE